MHFFLQIKGRVERHGSWSRVKTLWERICSNVQDRVWDLGFGPFLSLPILKVDKDLLMALSERWSSITQTFHLPMGEIGMPLVDFFMMTSLSMDDTPPPSTNEVDA